MIDIKSLFDDHKIEWTNKGKNATRGWIQIQCPSNTCTDSANHMGVNLKTGAFHCWICGKKGYIDFLLSQLLSVSIKRAKEIIKNYDDETIEFEEEKICSEAVSVKGFGPLTQMHKEYLISRKFDPDYLVKQYHIGGFGSWGRFPYRLGIPIIEKNKIVNFTARDVTGEQETRYDSLKNEEAVIPLKECVYNIDNIKTKNILIVEGPFDVWRMGGSTICFFGTAFKTDQLIPLFSKGIEKAFIMFDASANHHAEKLGWHLTPFIKGVEILLIEEKDPAEMSCEEALTIGNDLGIFMT